jgi:hypothetical protein
MRLFVATPDNFIESYVVSIRDIKFLDASKLSSWQNEENRGLQGVAVLTLAAGESCLFYTELSSYLQTAFSVLNVYMRST